jgi:hypothetical protein
MTELLVTLNRLNEKLLSNPKVVTKLYTRLNV